MDRSVLEGDPHRVLEGMAIAALRDRRRPGLRLRARRVPARDRAAEDRDQAGRAPAVPRRPHLRHRLLASASTSASAPARSSAARRRRSSPRSRAAAARRGRARRTRPRAASGASPTLINNVETFANVAPIVRNGGAWYASIGTEKSKGTKVFALAGKIAQHRARRGADGHARCARSSSTSAAASPTARSSRPRRPAARRAAASPRSTSTCRSTTSRSPASARSWARAASSSWTRRRAWSTSPSTSWSSAATSRAASASRAAPAPCRCTSLLDKITQGRGDARRPRRCSSSCASSLKSTSLCGLGQTAPNPVRQHAAPLPRRVPRPHRRAALPRRRLHDRADGSSRRREEARRERQDLHPERQAGERRRGPDDPRRRATSTASPSRALPPRGPRRDRRVPALPGRDRRASASSQPACMTRAEEGMVVTTELRAAPALPPADRRAAASPSATTSARSASSNGYCELQELGYAVGHGPRPLPVPDARARDRRLPPPLRPRPQPLRAVHALRAGLRRDRGRAHVGRARPRRRRPGHHRPERSPGASRRRCTSCGKCVQVCPTGALFEKVRPEAEMIKNRDFLVYLKTAREKKLWIR